MPAYKPTRPFKRPPTHPGELMREAIKEHLCMPVAEAARRMKISRQALHAVLRGRTDLSADMALRFARLTGDEPTLLVDMQERLNLWRARHRLAKVLREIEPAESAA